MAIIKVMDELLANKIAAGEVVERCSSVVKELVENSIDALSTEISVELIDAGTKEIKVIDNGKGMEEDDAVLAFSRHATSKIKDEDDLYHIETLGFRGEALAAISSVSNITLKTSTGDIGTLVKINGGKILEVSSSDAKRGTTICVNDLFYNTPARLKHLKSLYTELANVTEYINKLALSRPDIRFLLKNNGNVILSTDGSNNLLKTIKDVYGVEVAKKMLPVSIENSDYAIEGYISLPEVHRTSRNNMITLVNNRIVRNVELNRTINDSYHSLKPDTRYPIAILNITVDPILVDVNIHPTKMDIKFSKLEELNSLIEKMIKDKLYKRNLIPHVEVNSLETPKKVYEEIKLDLDRIGENKISYNTDKSIFKEKVDVEEQPLVLNKDLIKDGEILENEEISNEIEESEKRLPELYPVGLVHGTYIICQNDEGMYIIDQHAAKERVNYEMYKEKLGNPDGNSISMLVPITLEFSANEFIILKERFDFLKSLGFDIETFGINSLIVKSHPAWLKEGFEEEQVRKILEIVILCNKDFSITKFNEKAATMLSCKKAIKANMNITMEEMENLINDLRHCKNPFNCPHGRPTIIYYSNYDLEKLFKRSGF
ncbi:MAG: DNA mismatch repair endonuclease MutL [Clostridium sp.]|nr:DNA mismatch repair endonuclease MutL [Clostridium sp.]MCM1444314.1 DNA mismatch repair endonuclease MutL [Candidatus Amulumruptor caecigallinarius]